MDEGVGIVVAGAAGRMGRMLLRLLAEERRPGGPRLVGALVRPGHPWEGRDAGEAAGLGSLGVPAEGDPLDAMARAQAVIDFTAPAMTVELAALAAQARAVHVVGTTGLLPGDLTRLAAAARHAVVVRSGNMSLGVTLLAALVGRAAAALGEGWDVEVVEAHHRMKRDAPSGTALLLAAAAAEARGAALAEVAERGRDGMTGPRRPGAIGMASVRGGDVVGEHDVLFLGEGERLALRHVATDRMVFARGALQAALWGQDRAPGEYGMGDVLGL